MKSFKISLNLFSIFLLAVFANVIFAQNQKIHIPVNIQTAYEKGTRDISGNPGKNYWQNSADYSINVELIPTMREIIGDEIITYYNNSPDTLKELVMKIYHDIYSKGAARDITLSDDAIAEQISIESLKIDNADVTYRKQGTNLIVKLNSPINPKSKIEVSVKWKFQLTATTELRIGTFDETTFFVGYWFPRVAVYDDIDGWDRAIYTGHEFYNDFGNYEVNITVPKNYVVWATGALQNPEEVLSADILEKYKLAQTSDEIINIVTTDDSNSTNITAANEKNIWKYKADNVTDFAFGTSDHFLWDATSVVVDNNNRRVFVQSAYYSESSDFYDVAEVSKKSIYFLSNQTPGIPFPYPCLTVFNGLESGGMEFPMLVNDATMYFKSLMINTTSHEIAHTYFPFYCGTNETKYAWMDEGWAMTLPLDFQNEEDEFLDHTKIIVSSYLTIAGEEEDVPLMILSNQMSARGYSFAVNAYFRSALAYLILKETLGEDLFLTALQKYITTWAGKHPLPYDFFNLFSNVCEDNLDWFWKPWFYDFAYPDIAFENVDVEDDVVRIEIINIGKLPLPVNVKIFYAEDNVYTIQIFSNEWTENDYRIFIKATIKSPIQKIEIDVPFGLDINLENNILLF